MIVEVHALPCGGCTPFSLLEVGCSDSSFSSRMDKVESPVAMEERTCSAQTAGETELLGVEQKSHREWRELLGYILLDKPHWKGSGNKFFRLPPQLVRYVAYFSQICAGLSASWWFNSHPWVLALWKTWSAHLVIDIVTPTFRNTY